MQVGINTAHCADTGGSLDLTSGLVLCPFLVKRIVEGMYYSNQLET